MAHALLVNYYPKLKLSAKQTRTPPKTASPPAELEITPCIVQPLTPDSQVDSGPAVDQPTPSRVFDPDISDVVHQENGFQVDNSLIHVESFTPASEASPAMEMDTGAPELDTGTSELEHPMDALDENVAYTPLSLPEGDPVLDTDYDATLASLMTFLALDEVCSQARDVAETGEIHVQVCNEYEKSPSTSQSGQESLAHRTRNFRMSIDFLCHNPRPEEQPNSSTAPAEDNAGTMTRKRGPSKAKSTTALAIVDPNQCRTCKVNMVPQEMSSPTECRRCYRHYAIYNEAWPSRFSRAIAERLEAAEKEVFRDDPLEWFSHTDTLENI
jgi:hypothetical protein